MHVLSTPPAFILSQDQTLRCSSNPLAIHLIKRIITQFDLLHPLFSTGVLKSSCCLLPLTEGFKECKIRISSSFDFPESQIRSLLSPVTPFTSSPAVKPAQMQQTGSATLFLLTGPHISHRMSVQHFLAKQTLAGHSSRRTERDKSVSS